MSTEQPTPPSNTLPPPGPVEQGSALRRFWRGDFSLSISFWGFGAGGTAIVAMVLTMATVVAFVVNLHNRRRLAISLLAILGVTVLITLWQCVGIWRSTNQHIEQGKSQGFAFVVRFFVVVTIVQVAAIGFFLKPLWTLIETMLDQLDHQSDF